MTPSKALRCSGVTFEAGALLWASAVVGINATDAMAMNVWYLFNELHFYNCAVTLSTESTTAQAT